MSQELLLVACIVLAVILVPSFITVRQPSVYEDDTFPSTNAAGQPAE